MIYNFPLLVVYYICVQKYTGMTSHRRSVRGTKTDETARKGTNRKEIRGMPYIHTRVNRPISQEAEAALASRLGQAVSLLGKSENWLMLQFEDNCRLYFKGEDQQPMAFVCVQLYGKASRDAYDRMTGEITAILRDTLSIAPDRVYVAYQETDHWGWNGGNF